MKRPGTVRAYPGSLKGLAKDVANLWYDALTEFLGHLSQKIKEDAAKDKARGRVQLAEKLGYISYHLKMATGCAFEAWQICRPRMEG